MDLGLSEIQQMLRTSSQEFLSQEIPLSLVRAMEEDSRGYTDDLWRHVAGAGMDRAGVPGRPTAAPAATSLTSPSCWRKWDVPFCPGPFFSTVVLGAPDRSGRRKRRTETGPAAEKFVKANY